MFYFRDHSEIITDGMDGWSFVEANLGKVHVLQ